MVKLGQLVFSETYYYIDLLKGHKTDWDDWYRSSRSWTWQTSGNQFPANDANQNWNDANWDKFVLYVKVRLYTLTHLSLDSSTTLFLCYRNPIASSSAHIFILTTIIVVMILLA